MKEVFRGRELTAAPIRTPSGRWSVAVVVDGRRVSADDGISYILREEAEKEALNLGRNMVNRGLA